MFIRHLVLYFAAVVLTALMGTATCFAAAGAYGIIPFTVDGPASYKYLETGIPEMLSSRLYWQGQTQPADKNLLTGKSSPASKEAADALMTENGLEYLVWGKLSISGQDSVLSISAQKLGGSTWSKESRTRVDALIPSLEKIAGEINAQVIKRPVQQARASSAANPPAAVAETNKVQVLNPDIVYNETDNRTEYYLNPAFRYAGGADEGAIIRSPRLDMIGVGMGVGDADGDGLNEVFIIGENTIYALKYTGQNQLEELASYQFSKSLRALHIDVHDLNRDGKAEIILSCVDSDNVPKGMILNFDGSKFIETENNIPYFMAVHRVPPDYVPKLLLQKKSAFKLFEPGVYTAEKQGGKYTTGGRLLLPDEANVFNISYLPEGSSYKVVITGDRETLKVYSDTGSLLSKTDETYSGSPVAMEYYVMPPGMGVPTKAMESSMYYVPIRKIPCDLTGSGTYDLLVTRPISVAAQFFQRYRYFPQGEIHSLFWDNVGLNLRWKTRRIKGAVTDFALADITNNGQLDLAVCINTYPGALGVSARRTVLMIYPLDQAQTDTTPDHDVE